MTPLSKSKIIILQMLHAKPLRKRKIVQLYPILSDNIFPNYNSLDTDTKIQLKHLEKKGFIKREGKRPRDFYRITSRGILELVRFSIGKVVRLESV